MENNYFFVDGSALLADVRKARAAVGLPATATFDILAFVRYFAGMRFHEFHGGAYKRFVFYFVHDDERLRSTIIIPDFTRPGEVSDIRIEYCGKRIKQYEQAKEWLDQNNAPDFVRECLYRSEKAVDTRICCDALQLAAVNRLDRLFLYTNDYDFVPVCQTLRQMGANVNLFRIRSESVNTALVAECDAFHVMGESDLRACFHVQEPLPTPVAPEEVAG